MQGKPIVLIIDDEKGVCDSCSKVLNKEGYYTDAAEDGYIGLKKAKEIKPDLALIDLKMPGLSGMEVLEKIKDINSSIVPIVITSYSTIESAVEAMRLGAYDYLPKPFNANELKIVVKRGWERKKLIQEMATLREEKIRMEENFISLVTHELRSPLVAAEQYLAVILDEIVGKLEKMQKEMIIRARERIAGLLELVNDWLHLSGIRKEQIAKRYQPINLKILLSEVTNLMQPIAEKFSVTMKLEYFHTTPLIYGDKQTLKHLFINLISNGIKFNKKQGQVVISLKDRDNYLEVNIADTGIGISREQLPFIFEPFYRVRGKDTKKIIGTGLGLPIVKKIVEAHNAKISVESNLGQGSIFTVLLPKTKS